MLIDVETERFKALFGHHPFQTSSFASKQPPYEMLVRCLVDPSVCDDGQSPIDKIESVKQLWSAQVADVQLGAQYMVYKLAVRQVGDALNATTGLLKQYQPAIDLVMKGAHLASSIQEMEVEDLLVDAAFGAGMKALGAIGPVGKIAAAVVGFGKMIWDIIARREKIQQAEAAQREMMAWAQMPPLQEPSAATDAYMAQVDVIERMSGGSWTRIFAPRFDPDLPWVGVERKGGFAFAPGKTQPTKDLFGRDTQAFEPANGVGFVPGFDRITSVIQVSLPHDDIAVRRWKADRSYGWPVRPKHVRDVGSYYTNTSRLAAMAWAWATEQDATPNLYKIDVGQPDGKRSGCLHTQWQRYYARALRYLTENTGIWDQLRTDNLEFVYGSGLACAVATWMCKTKPGSTTYKPVFEPISPGLVGQEMNSSVWLQDHACGCALRPLEIQASAAGSPCLVSMYDSHVRETLVRVRQRQEHFLRHSLVCAYVREAWDAFLDPDMRTLLRKMRSILLKHPDRFLVDLEDVPEGEPFNGEDWKGQLIKAGVKKKVGPVDLAGVAGTLELSAEPPPEVPTWADKMPFADYRAAPGEGSTANPSRFGLGLLGGATALAGLLAYRRLKNGGKDKASWNP